MKSGDIRSAYLDFFARRDHRVVPSSSLVPQNDATLLFTNSGMVQFKDALAGREDLGFSRATTAQRCVRAGGKHNDLENVGYTARHHTFFEMLGNFSFADYFKEETITWAWEFLTQTLGMDPERLWVTVHKDDQESEELWATKVGFPRHKITRLGDASNFWTMGDTGPCGPNTEIFFDHGPSVPGGPPGTPDEDGDRFVEIWNLVFPQFDLQLDGTRAPLEKYGVDTGMGLERVAAALQGVHSNYEIDGFRGVLSAAAVLAKTNDMFGNPSLRVIADHIRSTAFLIADGVIPGNENRSYVLRRIMRRALRHGHKLGIREPFFHRLVAPLAVEMGKAYPELNDSLKQVERVVLAEEERFAETLSQGMDVLEREIAKLRGSVIPGDVAFKLYDTFGFPEDLTADVARERGLSVDHAGFEAAMALQKERARAASRFSVAEVLRPQLAQKTEFCGYEKIQNPARVMALYREGESGPQGVQSLTVGERGVVILDQTSFYAESGGQVGDVGTLECANGSFEVQDTQSASDQILHTGALTRGELRAGDLLEAKVDRARRQAIALNHSATHLLHAALRQILGNQVQQKGSLVDADRLRFDFSHFEAMTTAQIEQVEAIVNREIRHNTDVAKEVMAHRDAIAKGAMALFGEKYGDQVRVLTMGNGFSVELCGGTHVNRTGDIGLFRIVAESGVSAGVRRIEALSGANALQWIAAGDRALKEAAALVKGGREELPKRVQQLLDTQHDLQKEIEQLKAKLANAQSGDLLAEIEELAGVKVLIKELKGQDPDGMMNTFDALKGKMTDGVILLAVSHAGSVSLVAHVGKALTNKIKAGDLVRDVGKVMGAKGGGRPDMARAGGGNPELLGKALAMVNEWIGSRV